MVGEVYVAAHVSVHDKLYVLVVACGVRGPGYVLVIIVVYVEAPVIYVELGFRRQVVEYELAVINPIPGVIRERSVEVRRRDVGHAPAIVVEQGEPVVPNAAGPYAHRAVSASIDIELRARHGKSAEVRGYIRLAHIGVVGCQVEGYFCSGQIERVRAALGNEYEIIVAYPDVFYVRDRTRRRGRQTYGRGKRSLGCISARIVYRLNLKGFDYALGSAGRALAGTQAVELQGDSLLLDNRAKTLARKQREPEHESKRAYPGIADSPLRPPLPKRWHATGEAKARP